MNGFSLDLFDIFFVLPSYLCMVAIIIAAVFSFKSYNLLKKHFATKSTKDENTKH